jgi:hypothetical protein
MTIFDTFRTFENEWEPFWDIFRQKWQKTSFLQKLFFENLFSQNRFVKLSRR